VALPVFTQGAMLGAIMPVAMLGLISDCFPFQPRQPSSASAPIGFKVDCATENPEAPQSHQANKKVSTHRAAELVDGMEHLIANTV
jgi:hypothetical protein